MGWVCHRRLARARGACDRSGPSTHKSAHRERGARRHPLLSGPTRLGRGTLWRALSLRAKLQRVRRDGDRPLWRVAWGLVGGTPLAPLRSVDPRQHVRPSAFE